MDQCSWKKDVREKLPMLSFLKMQFSNFNIHVLEDIHVKDLSVSSSPYFHDSSCPPIDKRGNSSPKAAVQVSQGCLWFTSADTPKPGCGPSHEHESLLLSALLIFMYNLLPHWGKSFWPGRVGWVRKACLMHYTHFVSSSSFDQRNS